MVTCVPNENAAVRCAPWSVPVNTSGYVPPGMLPEPVNRSVVPAVPQEFRYTVGLSNCPATPAGTPLTPRFTLPPAPFTDCTVTG